MRLITDKKAACFTAENIQHQTEVIGLGSMA